MKEAFDFRVLKDDLKRVDFLHNERDCSHMHLEILKTIAKDLKPPGNVPT